MHTRGEPTADRQDDAYREWKSWTQEEFGHCDSLEARYFETELARAGVALTTGMPLLEIGFGNGTFAAWANARQFDYTGTELDPELVRRAQTRGWRAIQATLSLDALDMPSSPHCIVILDVLEHLSADQIVELLRSAASVLADDGLLVARVPSGDSPFARSIQHGDITHRSILGSSAIRQLAEMAGMRVAQIRAPVLPLRGIGLRRWLRRAPVVASRSLLANLIRPIFHDNQPTVITANMLVVLHKALPTATMEQRA